MTAGVYLEAYLAPLAPWLSRPDVTDLLINRPGEVWIETADGTMSREPADQLTEVALTRLARQIAAASHQGVNREQPLLSATLPDGARVQVVSPPATRGGLAMAVRKHLISDMSLDELSRDGLFDAAARTDPARDAQADADLEALIDTGDLIGFLKLAVKRRKTVVISGGTASGKTTLLNALVKEIARSERLVVIEDAPEVRLDHPNAVGLVAVRGELGEAQVDADALLAAALRLRPDRILLGELRGREAFAWLRAVNSGHPGSITTVHADSPAGALDQIALLALTSGVDLGWDKVRTYVERVVDVVVQLDRTGGARRLTEVLFRPGRSST
ncbi:MAG TPA: P-type DNA transfer ATPase VirB11 [Phenylobacterium sp.]|jgi:type IV secretion system protein VirB11|uniref:P-type DNA transfer ATPase VirB11 n=1 Tax=Phenylobacterium sp. TaxID=1871053 RepID=UPI002D6D3AB4|nr:P-type DNA transfer ATPase VirB11 [Phenylobacterium sp.]HZZ69408.1 P-type DNA transfer ATPase VirB11 [Phenylobacterium sp.]